MVRHHRQHARRVRYPTQQILAAADFKLARYWRCAHRRECLFHWLANWPIRQAWGRLGSGRTFLRLCFLSRQIERAIVELDHVTFANQPVKIGSKG